MSGMEKSPGLIIVQIDGMSRPVSLGLYPPA